MPWRADLFLDRRALQQAERFLSANPYTTAPQNTQNFNRYSYMRIQRGATEEISWRPGAVAVRQAANKEGGYSTGLTPDRPRY
jgi:hypothetical protein